MHDSFSGQNLSQIGTLWTVVRQAHGGSPEVVSQAQQALMERYSGSVYRYLLGALRDRHAADDLFQEFALRFVRGAFRNANPDRGRFRDFVKTALYHLIVDYQKRERRAPRTLPVEECGAEPAVLDLHYSEAEFVQSWRQEILCRTWEALAAECASGAQSYYRVLRMRAENDALTSAQMAEQLSAQLGQAVNAAWVRQTLRRARDRFADLLLRELAASLDDPSRERLEQELIDLDLWRYCQQALQQRSS
jgi:RNA polymerase sigma-70 factor (ECF subfamily)